MYNSVSFKTISKHIQYPLLSTNIYIQQHCILIMRPMITFQTGGTQKVYHTSTKKYFTSEKSTSSISPIQSLYA